MRLESIHFPSILITVVSVAVFSGGTYIEVPNTVIDQGFNKLDKNGDGQMDLAEFETIVSKDDKDGDGCVTREEYENGAPVAHALTDKMYAHFEYKHSGCLNVQEMATEFQVIDKNADGIVDVFEYEVYFKNLMVSLFS